MRCMHLSIARRFIFWSSLRAKLKRCRQRLARRLVLIAESDLNDPRVVTPREAGGFGIDAQWSDDFHHALFTVLCPSRKARLLRRLRLARAVGQGAGAEPLCTTASTPAIASASTADLRRGLSQHRFLGYIQNHDQVGNRAMGDRISHIAGIERAKIAAALVLTEPLRAHAVSGRRMGSIDSVPIFRRSRAIPSWPAPFQKGESGSSRHSAGTLQRFPTRRIPQRSRHRSSSGNEVEQPATRRCWHGIAP